MPSIWSCQGHIEPDAPMTNSEPFSEGTWLEDWALSPKGRVLPQSSSPAVPNLHHRGCFLSVNSHPTPRGLQRGSLD